MIKINPEQDFEVVLDIATKMCVAARTAPKANGLDSIVTAIVYGEELDKIREEMVRFGTERNLQYFIRDAKNIEGKVVVIIGSKPKEKAHGFEDGESEETVLKESSAIDLGIAIGSAVSLGKDLCIDNRVMYSIGRAAINLKILGEDVIIAYGIPLSISGKNPFFDRK
ncbi:MAG: ferredoxin domain-containing protein [Caldisericum exile]|uniref:ferredoxin domain-containing protein n=1 Tax=Caldisericum TaxID=693074 RepID=UPI0039FC115D